MRYFLFILLLIPTLAFADCKLKKATSISVLDSNFNPMKYTTYQGYIQPNWVKVPNVFYLSIFTKKCKRKQFTGITNLSVTSFGITKQYNVSFLNGISSPIIFIWDKSGIQNMNITISSKKSSVFLNTSFFEVIVPKDPIIYQKELY